MKIDTKQQPTNSYNTYLQQEAQFQDHKIEDNPRAHLNRVYNDKASKVRYDYRNMLLADLSGQHVLDLGCGNGFASLEALRAGAYVTAIDISPKSIEHLLSVAYAEQLDHHLTAAVMDAHHLDIADESVDIVFGNGILHHLPDLSKALHEIRRVLKPAGYAVFSEPLGMNPLLQLFRKVTPTLRTKNEQPFRIQELSLISSIFHETSFVFFDLFTLLAKAPLVLNMKKTSCWLEDKLIAVDKFVLRRNKTKRITFLQRMSWMVIIKMTKEQG